jgi:hypothetical protein
VVASTGDRFAVNFAVNLISAVTAKGKLRFAAYDGNLNGRVFIDFCRRLLHDSPGPVFLVLDGHPCTAPTRLGLCRLNRRPAAAVLPAGVSAGAEP